MAFLETREIWKEFWQAGQTVEALRCISLSIERGEFAVVTGESGCGKSTLLSLLAGLDRPSRGSVRFRGEPLEAAAPGRLARLRRDHMGFVFQDFRLVRHLTVRDNVRLPLLFCENSSGEETVADLVDRVNLAHRLGHRTDALSRGEMQRVALARALVNRPAVLFADEPTANLDHRNSEEIWELLQDLNRTEGLTVIVASHSEDVVKKKGRVILLHDGNLVTDERA